MKKIISLFLIAIMAVALLSGCGEVPANTVFSADDLWGKQIGVQLGTTGDIFASDYEKPTNADEVESGVEYSTINRFNKGNDAVMSLVQGKIDCVIIDREPAKAFVAENKSLKILDDPFAVEEYAICFKKDNEDLTTKFNQALKELKDTGVVDQIIKNFIGDDTIGTCPYTTPEGTTYPNGKLTMATNAFFPPYEYYEGDKVVGIDPMLAKAICDKLGYELEILDCEFDVIINNVDSGKADFGMAGMTITEKRLESVNFSDPYTTSTQVIIVRNK